MKRKEKEGEEETRTREKTLSSQGIEIDCEIPDDLDIDRLLAAIKESQYLKEWKFLSKYLSKLDRIYAGFYKSYYNPKEQKKDEYMQNKYTPEQLANILVKFDDE